MLQGAYFTPIDLSTLAHKMDEAERQRMAENGEESEDYQRFLQQPSGNMDDSGYFSVQVISSALEVWGLELVPYSSTDQRVKHVFENPCEMKAFICNYKDHWFTIRKIGVRWFNLNSLLSKPQPISNTYLSLFLAQLKNEGYSIFVVFGELPPSDADQALMNSNVNSYTDNPDLSPDESDLNRAIQLSLEMPNDDSDLDRAIQLSLGKKSDETVRTEEEDEEALLEKAINMSLEC